MDYDICDMRFINLNSSDAVKNNSAYLSDVQFNFTNILNDEDSINYITCGVLNAQIPVSFNTINYTNYILYFSVDGGSVIPLLVTRGNYNSNSLITELVNEFTLLGYTFTITTSKITGLMTFTCVGHNFVFYGTSTLFPVLGFTAGTNYSSTVGVLTATYPLNLLGIKRLKINSTALATNVYDSDGLSLSSNIASIPVNVQSFGLIDYVNNSNAFPMLKSKNITYIDIQIVDEDNNKINFNGVNWTMTVQLNIYRKGRKEDNSTVFQPVIDVLTDIKEELAPPDKTDSENEQNTEATDNTPIENTVLDPVEPTDDDLDILMYNGEL
jgi:hypothetical protein